MFPKWKTKDVSIYLKNHNLYYESISLVIASIFIIAFYDHYIVKQILSVIYVLILP